MSNKFNLQSQIKPLVEYFEQLMPLTAKEKNLVVRLFTHRLFRKRQYILQEGDVCNQCNFIVRGCLRMYKMDADGNTHVIQFAAENGWIMDISSFHSRTASELAIDALEDSVVLQISYENFLLLYQQAPKFNRIFRVLIERSYIAMQKRLLQNISSTAEDRYISFHKTYSHLSHRLPQTQIASFLGISPEFLSRLRNKQAKRKS